MKVISIGRSNDNDVRIDDLYVGRHHCQIVQHDNGTYTIVDMNSKNGTFVNGRRIFGEVQLQPYDSVTIGHTNLPWRNFFPPKSKSYALPIVLGSVAGALLLVMALLLLVRTRGLGDEKVLYKGPEPPVTVVTLEEDGEIYKVCASEGQMIVVFDNMVSHKEAVRILRKNHAKIIAQMPDVHYYLVEVSSGKEKELFSLLRTFPEVDYVFPNIIEDICSAVPYVLDDFRLNHGDNHGKRVVDMIEESGTNAEICNIGINDDSERINIYKGKEYLKDVLNNLSDDESAVFNLSFGPSLSRLSMLIGDWDRWEWQHHRVLWDDIFITKLEKRSFVNSYIYGLIGWIDLVEPYANKDFVIVKAIGNEGMKEMESILGELRRKLNDDRKYSIFEHHFLLVSAKDDNKEGDYPNDVERFNTMVTKVDISDKTAQDFHWQGTSFASPRAGGYVVAAANKHNMKVTDVLEQVRKATLLHPEHLLTMEGLTEQITKSKSSQVVESGTSVLPPPSMLSTEQIKQDIVGAVIRDPSPKSYFPDGWTWTLKRNEIAGVTIKNETETNGNQHSATVTIHLKRHQLSVDVDAVIRYRQVGSGWKYEGLTVQRITFPPQQDYSSYVKIYMDYDFMPSLVVKNTSGMALFVAGSYTIKGEATRFSTELKPYENKMLGIGPSPDSYSIHFAYKE